MNLAQFIATATLIFMFPYMPLAIAGCKIGAFGGAPCEGRKIGLVWYWVAEGGIALCVLLLAVYLSQVATFTGLIDSDMFSKGPRYMEALWDFARYAILSLGLLLGGRLIYRGVRLYSSNRRFAWSQLFLGGFCVLYGFAVPTIMAAFLAAIRDSHLMH